VRSPENNEVGVGGGVQDLVVRTAAAKLDVDQTLLECLRREETA
jgi:hypothetical protein